MSKLTEFLYKLFFDREDSLDTLQVLFTAIVIVALMVVWRLSIGVEDPSVKIESLVTIRWLVGLLVVTAVPKWMIPAMTKILTKGSLPKSSTTPTPPYHEESTESTHP